MCEPRDGVRLARPGAVLNEVVDARPIRRRVSGEGSGSVPLVKPWEHDGAARSTARACAAFCLHMDEPGKQVQPSVALPHLLPQVRGLVARGMRRVTGSS